MAADRNTARPDNFKAMRGRYTTSANRTPERPGPRRPSAFWKHLGLAIGAVVGALWLASLSLPERSDWVARGPMNTGHERLACPECHLPAPGTVAQQFSANVYDWMGLRERSSEFGSQDVDSQVCLDCHRRPDDRHPVSRFLEPHFVEARHQIGVHECTACHAEHHGKRVTLPTMGFCVHCHGDTALQDDPIVPTHAALVQAESWHTCLQCHDFHGNHHRQTPTRLADGVAEARVRAYFDGAPSPYSTVKHWKAVPSRALIPKEKRGTFMDGEPSARGAPLE